MSGLERFIADILGRQIYAALSRARIGTSAEFDIRAVISEAIDVALGMLDHEDGLLSSCPYEADCSDKRSLPN